MDGSTLRLFFALWPAPRTRAALARVAGQVADETGGRAVAADNLHLTLAFLGERPADLVARLSEVAAGIECAAFTLQLDDVGYWRKTGLAWLGAVAPPVELTNLQRELVRVLAGVGVEQEARLFAAHITLVRRIGTIVPRRLASRIAWHVDSFSLVASELGREGARYSVVETWPLRARAA
ncbi:MAG: RNA 2',3'-cyclic phosphodiesterase [Casimicrobiaceae bacterium]